jgi:hypothetical protein
MRTAVGIQVSQGKVVLILNSSPRQEDVWRNGGISPRILSSAPVSGQHHAAFAPLSEDVPPILFGWAPEPGLNALRRFCPCQESNPDFLIVQAIA